MSSHSDAYAEIEIGLLRRLQEQTYLLELRVSDPSSDTESQPRHAQAQILLNELQALGLEPVEYGQRLTDQLFADPELRVAYRTAKATFDAQGRTIRLRLLIDAAIAELNDVRWELLLDPETRQPLATSQRMLFSRFMRGQDRRQLKLRPKSGLRAVIAVAAPHDVADWGLAAIDKPGEIARAREALAGISVSVAAESTPLTAVQLIDAMRQGYDIVYLAAHGALPREHPACVYLQDEEGNTAPLTASELAQQIAELPDPPRLIVLASCESASREDSSSPDGASAARTALAPLLADAGIPAVIAMQGKITMETAKHAMPVFFRELAKDGQIDRAMAAARATVRERPDSWMPALFLRLKNGRIWPEERRPQTLDGRNRQAMLKRVRADWIDGVLMHSLYEVSRIELELQTASVQVERSMNVVVQTPDEPARPLPAGTAISQIFEQSDNSLLILGAPGTGKTTLLLELAEDLLNRAELDDNQPMPVIFNLSSWAVKRLELSRWMVAELNERSNVPRRVAQDWVDKNQIIPLLDGLDEVAAEHREACVGAINAYWDDHGLLPMAVCSRIADYQNLKAKLRLRRAILVQPLTRSQVETYLEHIGEPVRTLRAALESEPSLWELLESPLMLWVALFAYRYSPAEASQERPQQQRTQLFAKFVDAMFKRRAAETRYTRQQFLRWLSWLAGTLNKNDQTVLYLENLRAKWLPPPLRLFAAAGTIAACGALFGLVTTVPVLMAFTSHPSRAAAMEVKSAFDVFWIIGSVFGLVGIFAGTRPVEKLRFSLSGLSSRVGRAFGIGVTCVLICGLGFLAAITGSDWLKVWGGWRTFASMALFGLLAELSGIALVGGLVVGLPIALISLPFSEAVETRTKPNHGTIYSAKAAISAVGVVGVGVGLWIFAVRPATGSAWSSFERFVDGLSIGSLLGLFLALFSVGGLFALKHYVLRLVLWATRSAPLNYVRFLDASADRLFLRKVGGGYIFTHRLLLEYFATSALSPQVQSESSGSKPASAYKQAEAGK